MRGAVARGEISARALAETYLTRIAAQNDVLGAYLAVPRDGEHSAMAVAEAVDHKRARGEALGTLAGVPLGIKDVIVTRGVATTAGSKLLQDWVPPYDATVMTRLRGQDAVMLGKLNCDEFAMGSSNEHSAYGPCKNPWDLTRVPGGSSGGSAAAVAAGLCAASLGSDTGGSIRQPAAFCGIAGLKPTYGLVSRYGLIAFASSLDQIGPMGRHVDDLAILLEAMIAHDPHDGTSVAAPQAERVVREIAAHSPHAGSLQGLRVGLPREYMEGEVAPAIATAVAAAATMLRDAGADVVEMSLPHTTLALPTYYLIAPAEASANLARFDGIRYGKNLADAAAPLTEMYEQTRGRGFGPEVKRRIMLGTYALRTGYYDAYFKKAQQVRALIRQDFIDMPVDMVLTPTTPTTAFRAGEKSDPVAMYLADIFTLACNLAGVPGMSVPVAMADGLPIGVQLMGKWFGEAKLLRAGAVIEAGAGMVTLRPPMMAKQEAA
ncbi:MAG: Asp-tRNA(Asn)/Glu-tRNA(Gln) amidotransferase subunit GatA [Myxococcales bacterium]|nr:Asp-tRNA(Asn)/Glu-tRNA(Gln) amidotransferase subunit GatA [Myxococcales bacterium]